MIPTPTQVSEDIRDSALGENGPGARVTMCSSAWRLLSTPIDRVAIYAAPSPFTSRPSPAGTCTGSGAPRRLSREQRQVKREQIALGEVSTQLLGDLVCEQEAAFAFDLDAGFTN
jgi:hypothetical protein